MPVPVAPPGCPVWCPPAPCPPPPPPPPPEPCATCPELTIGFEGLYWITRKQNQPFSFQAACRVFKNPPGLNAAALIAQAGLAGTKVGGAEVSERDANYLIAQPGATSRDVLRLIDLVRTRVLERFNAELELELSVW